MPSGSISEKMLERSSSWLLSSIFLRDRDMGKLSYVKIIRGMQLHIHALT